MIYAKLRFSGLGEFWIECPFRDNLQAEKWAEGLAQGWNLGRRERAEVTDIRLSKHPTEPLRDLETVAKFLGFPEERTI